jgi:hypothetical protein
MYEDGDVDGNKIDYGKNRKILVRLKSKKVQVWE